MSPLVLLRLGQEANPRLVDLFLLSRAFDQFATSPAFAICSSDLFFSFRLVNNFSFFLLPASLLVAAVAVVVVVVGVAAVVVAAAVAGVFGAAVAVVVVNGASAVEISER